ncbi:MAG TPA: glycoside hydrolase domain-containing protein, partial [Planctomycetota bacterium]|nr:glycoside hydrolase domain-containing protein [Planctomycetota bacterium]
MKLGREKKGGARVWMVGALMCWVGLVCGGLAAEDGARVLADFNQDTGIFKDPPAAETVAGLGGKAVKITDKDALKSEAPGHDWPEYTTLRFEVFNPNETPARLQLMLKDGDAPHGYFSWVNRYVSVAPGKHTLDFQIAGLKRGEGGNKDSLDPRPFKWAQMEFFMIAGDTKPMFVANIRLVKEAVFGFAELKAFDFGPKAGGVGFLGFTEVTPEAAYAAQPGYGWVGGAPPYARHRMHPCDELVGDWISGENITFRIDLPDGAYEGFALMEDPGEWELYQNFTQRSLAVNDKIVYEEKETGAEFLDRYFHFAETEDHPGDNIWDRYVAWRYPLRKFEFVAAGGKAEFNVRSSGQYAGTLNALAVWPKAKTADGQAFLADLEKRRRKSMADSWTELLPKKQALDAAAAAPFQAQGYVPFQRSTSVDVGYYDGPTATAETALQFEATAMRGQRVPLQFAIHALKDLTGLMLSAGEFKAADGSVLSATAVECGFVNYKFKRIGFGGQGQYGSVPFVIKPFTATEGATTALTGTARQFWVTITVPADQKAGVYAGSFTLKAAGLPDRMVPAKLTVLGATLPDADMGLGFYGYSTAPWSAYNFPENQARIESDVKTMLTDLRVHGVSLYTVGGVKFLGFANGAGRWDVSQAEAQYKVGQAAGFPFIQVLADDNGTLDQIALDPAAAAKKFGFPDADAVLKASFGTVNDVCKAHGLPAPLFSFGDEPGTKPVMDKLAVMYANIRKAGAVGTIAYSTSDPITQPLLDLLGVSCLNQTTVADMERARKAGNRLMFNNQGRNRWAYGWYMQKAHAAGVEGYQQFIYSGPHIDIYNPFDGTEDEESMVYPDRAGHLRA